MLKGVAFSCLLAGVLSDNYFIGSQYELDYSSAQVTESGEPYTVKLVSSQGSFDIPGGDNIKPGMTIATLSSIDLYGKTDSLLIPQNEEGFIQVRNKNDSTVLNKTVQILQSIFIDDTLQSSVQVINSSFLISGIQVSRYLYENVSNSNSKFFASIIDVFTNKTWTPKTIFNESLQLSSSNSRSLLSKPIFTKFYSQKDNNNDNVDVILCDSPDYCRGTLSFDIPANSMQGGPYIVNLMYSISGEYNNTNAFTVAGREGLVDQSGISEQDKLIIYDDTKVDIKLKNASLKNGLMNPVPYYYFEPGKIDIEIEGLQESTCLFVTLYDMVSMEYAARCGAANLTDFTVLDWLFKDINAIDDYPFNFTELNGTYQVNIYFDPDCNDTVEDKNLFKVDTNNYLYLSIEKLIVDENNTNSTNGSTVIEVMPVNITNNNEYNAGEHTTFNIITSFSFGTMIEYYFETCINTTTNCSIINTTNGAFDQFEYTENPTPLSVGIPRELKLTKISKNENITNNIVFLIYGCDDEGPLEVAIDLRIIESGGGSSSNALSAGAIVGIVCAGVLVCGLAAWWICMRKSQGDGYRQLD